MLAAAERERNECGQTRSAFFRQAIDAWLTKQAERQAVARYIEACRSQPETPEEIEAADQAASILAQEPWE
jgi:hypothetical protein